MNILLIILIILGATIAMIVILGFMSPRIARFERSTEINATPEKVFEQCNSLRNFVNNWSPWTEKDPNLKQTYSGKENGVGAMYSWDGDKKKVGAGTMEITDSVLNRSVTTHIEFNGRGRADATWTIENISGKVKVTWDFVADNGNNPVARIFGRMMEKFMGGDYEYGLKKLKSHCEK